jgi:methionine synthase II (cobalamin-independent)
MVRNTISPEEGKRLKRLYAELAAATARSMAALEAHGMNSIQFDEADAAMGAVIRQIKGILGTAGSHWME